MAAVSRGARGGVHSRFPLAGGGLRGEKLWDLLALGGHAGGDSVMLDDSFLPQRPVDKYLRASDHRGGAYAILTGVAANRSFLSGKAVQIADLIRTLRCRSIQRGQRVRINLPHATERPDKV